MIEPQDVNASKDNLIASLINENLRLGAELIALRRELSKPEEERLRDEAMEQAKQAHPSSNGKVERSLSVAPPSVQ